MTRPISDEGIVSIGPAMADALEPAIDVIGGSRSKLLRTFVDALRTCDPDAVRSAAEAVVYGEGEDCDG